MRIAVLADIHGNVLALEAVLDDLRHRGGADLTVNLGDSVSGPLWPRETMERLEALKLPTVRGNHDRRVAADPADETMWASDVYAQQRLTPAQRDALFAQPLILEIAPGVIAFHARPDHDEKYLLDAIVDGQLVRAPLATIRRRLKGPGPACRIALCGHSHRAELIRIPDGPVIFNPGSIGCPAYDDDTPPAHVSEQGSPHARYGIVTLGGAGQPDRFEMIAVDYDHEAAARQAEQAGRPEWAHGLRNGFMPEAARP
ncbi:metallophosphoesterase family protein [Mesorhizobium sp. B2-5-13]|uniref:metallophosphoesterase family protein n=1 Tax=unclassified Mesorhizobium TaxID=325217 RepID=UPI001128D4B6|nr:MULTISPECIES: metallophosphoesterase family protein [unclassified Mesorhizobium]TPJ33526.1 metallophosphoesterase family protein [Mesorhizobium sp. B2-6-5]TPJ73860.1 metallophosphoesterase family protein [Mesorhizobium sp. B2-5-13]TPK39845.1 metallophosphoesterase family protein [Mesorhizobium sp. B2-5-5]